MALSNALKTDVNNPLQSAPKTKAVPDSGDADWMTAPTRAKAAEVEKLSGQLPQAQANVATAQSNIEADVLRRKAEVTKDYARNVQGLQEQADRDTWAEPAFNPTKSQPMEIGKIFSMIATMGVMSGGAGKMGAMQSMNAMTGMLKGYQAGDQEAYERAKVEYDEGMKTIQSHNALILKHLENAMSLAATDREAANIEQEMAARNAGGSSIITAQLNQGKIEEAIKTAQASLNMLQKTDEMVYSRKLAAAQADEARRFSRETALMVRETPSGSSTVGRTSALLSGRAENIREAITQVAADVKNITSMKKDKDGNPVMLGTFSDMAGEGGDTLLQSLSNSFARKLTSTDERMLSQLVAGIETNLSMALGGGYASSGAKSRIDQYKAQVPRAGDSGYAAATFLARIRQEMNILSENFPSKPGSTPAMTDAVLKANDVINQSVPFTVEDVIDARNGYGKPSAPATSGTPASTKQYKTEKEAQDAVNRGEIQDGDTVYIGGVAHKWKK